MLCSYPTCVPIYTRLLVRNIDALIYLLNRFRFDSGGVNKLYLLTRSATSPSFLNDGGIALAYLYGTEHINHQIGGTLYMEGSPLFGDEYAQFHINNWRNPPCSVIGVFSLIFRDVIEAKNEVGA